MNLQRGITGIYGRNDNSPVLPSTDLNSFRSHCHLAARVVGAKVQAVKNPYDGVQVCNFAIAYFGFSDTTVVLLLNAVHPVIAFAKCTVEGQLIFDYIDCPKLAEVFQSLSDYSILSSIELDRPLVRDLCKDLAPAEVKRVRYFRPRRVGDVIFNFWD